MRLDARPGLSLHGQPARFDQDLHIAIMMQLVGRLVHRVDDAVRYGECDECGEDQNGEATPIALPPPPPPPPPPPSLPPRGGGGPPPPPLRRPPADLGGGGQGAGVGNRSRLHP